MSPSEVAEQALRSNRGAPSSPSQQFVSYAADSQAPPRDPAWDLSRSQPGPASGTQARPRRSILALDPASGEHHPAYGEVVVEDDEVGPELGPGGRCAVFDAEQPGRGRPRRRQPTKICAEHLLCERRRFHGPDPSRLSFRGIAEPDCSGDLARREQKMTLARSAPRSHVSAWERTSCDAPASATRPP